MYKHTRELEKQHKQQVQQELDVWLEEFIAENPEWVKNKRLEYLYKQFINYLKSWISLTDVVLKTKDTKDEWLGEMIKDGKLKNTEKKINTIQTEINSWQQPEYKPGKITQEHIDYAKNSDCENFIEVKRQSGKVKLAICPFHDDSNPSLHLYPGNKGFYCFSCSTGGDAITLVQKIYNLNFLQAIKLINKL